MRTLMIFMFLTSAALARNVVLDYPESESEFTIPINHADTFKQNCNKEGGGCSTSKNGHVVNDGCCIGYICGERMASRDSKCHIDPANAKLDLGKHCSENSDCYSGNCVDDNCGVAYLICKKKGEKCTKLKVPAGGCQIGKSCKSRDDCCPNPGQAIAVCDNKSYPDYTATNKCTTGMP